VPSAYDGNSSATQAPSAAPEPEGTITVNLPVDADPPNGSTFEQAFKVLADFIRWLMIPTAKIGDYVGHIMGWRAANGQKRFVVDHLGFPAGQIFQKHTCWPGHSEISAGHFGTTAAEAYAPNPAWRIQLNGAGAFIDAQIPSPAAPPVTALKMGVISGSGGDYAAMSSGPSVMLVPGNHVTYEFIIGAEDDEANVTPCAVGLGVYTDGSGVGVAEFIGFESRGGTTLQAVTRHLGAETVTNTGVTIPRGPNAGAGMNRCKIEWHGASVAEDAIERVRFYVDGALVASHTANLPGNEKVSEVIGVVLSGPVGDSIWVGPVRLYANLFPQDVA
jgi:hypothetical protein